MWFIPREFAVTFRGGMNFCRCFLLFPLRTGGFIVGSCNSAEGAIVWKKSSVNMLHALYTQMYLNNN